MKNLILATILCGFSIISNAQKAVPESVKKTFTEKFAAAKSVTWASESANEWEAEFTLNGKEMSSSFDNSGKWLETETEISSKELPAAVSLTITNQFAGYKTGELSAIETPEVKGFEIALSKGKSTIEVVINAEGKVLRNTAATKK